MIITVGADLEAALNQHAQRQGVSPESLAVKILQERFLLKEQSETPQDEWERLVLGMAIDCGHSLPSSSLSSDELYE